MCACMQILKWKVVWKEDAVANYRWELFHCSSLMKCRHCHLRFFFQTQTGHDTHQPALLIGWNDKLSFLKSLIRSYFTLLLFYCHSLVVNVKPQKHFAESNIGPLVVPTLQFMLNKVKIIAHT